MTTTWAEQYLQVVHMLEAAHRRISALEGDMVVALNAAVASEAECDAMATRGKAFARIYQEHITALEADVARLTEYGAHLKDALINAQAGLERQGNVLRTRAQPCDHTPPGSDPDCVLCRVRRAFIHRIPWQCESYGDALLRAFDASVHAIREGQG